MPYIEYSILYDWMCPMRAVSFSNPEFADNIKFLGIGFYQTNRSPTFVITVQHVVCGNDRTFALSAASWSWSSRVEYLPFVTILIQLDRQLHNLQQSCWVLIFINQKTLCGLENLKPHSPCGQVNAIVSTLMMNIKWNPLINDMVSYKYVLQTKNS